jgi:hypothetical protein
MLVLKWLAGLAVVLTLLYFAFVDSYIWSAGLDFQNPSSAREWIKVCARSRIDIYCEAADRVLRNTEGPVIFLHPNMGDDEIASEMARWSGQTPTSAQADAIARANLFLGSALATGTMKTLDGQKRKIVCPAPDQKIACTIDSFRGGVENNSHTSDDGSIISLNRSKTGEMFFLPKSKVQLR